MYRLYITCFIVLLYAFGYSAIASTFRQERAKVKYTNEKYLKDVVVFTSRKGRHDPYLTNMTATLLKPFGNNVTVVVSLVLSSGGDFRFAEKVCDSLKSVKWMRDFMVSYTNLTLSKCPISAGRYRYMNMELPPRNIPVPIADGDYYIQFELYVTATKEMILDVSTQLHLDQNKKSRKG